VDQLYKKIVCLTAVVFVMGFGLGHVSHYYFGKSPETLKKISQLPYLNNDELNKLTQALDAPYLSTPQHVVDKMLEWAKVTKDDLVYDLGCGDGRIVITAAKKYGARGIGVDIDPDRVLEARENVKRAGVAHLVTIRQADIMKLDFSDADVLAIYLLPQALRSLIPQFEKLKEGSRIVSHDYFIHLKYVYDRKTVELDPKLHPIDYKIYQDLSQKMYKMVKVNNDAIGADRAAKVAALKNFGEIYFTYTTLYEKFRSHTLFYYELPLEVDADK